jgi:hypothetical protein
VLFGLNRSSVVVVTMKSNLGICPFVGLFVSPYLLPKEVVKDFLGFF